MAKGFLAAFLTGLILTLLAAGFYPLSQNLRLRSINAPLADGGRQETFYIDLPGDLIESPVQAGLSAAGAGLTAAGNGLLTAELFRLRNTEGVVVGTASRIVGPVTGADGRRRTARDWLLLLPNRGALMLSRGGDALVREADLPASSEAVPADGSTVAVPKKQSRTDPSAGQVIDATDEFAGLRGTFTEAPSASPDQGDGVQRSRIELAMTLRVPKP